MSLQIIIDQLCNEAVVYNGKPDKQAFLSAIIEEIRKVVPKKKDLSGMFQVDAVYRPPLKDGDRINQEYINYEQRIGYNQAIADMHANLDKIEGGK